MKQRAGWRSALARPFAAEHISWRPQEFSEDGQRALAVPYGKLRAYEDRLNEAVPDWKSRTQVVVAGERLVCIIHLTIDRITRSGVGECPISDSNAATSAYAQAFKRASSAFGLGRYLYDLPKEWVECDGQFFTPAALERLNALYGWAACGREGRTTGHAPSSTGGNGTEESGGNGNKPPAASLGQRRKIAALLKQLGYDSTEKQHAALQKAGFPIPLSEPEATLAIRRLEKKARTVTKANGNKQKQ